MTKTITAALLASFLATGCVVTPRPVVIRSVPPPSPYTAPVVEEEYVPPQEYVVDAPVFYDTMPGVAFYPIFINTPGSCFCVLPMRFYRGAWVGIDGAVIHRGHFPFRHAEPHYLTEWRSHGGVVNGMRPLRGTFEYHGGKLRPMPPANTIHHEVIMKRDFQPVSTRLPEQRQPAQVSPAPRPQPAQQSAQPFPAQVSPAPKPQPPQQSAQPVPAQVSHAQKPQPPQQSAQPSQAQVSERKPRPQQQSAQPRSAQVGHAPEHEPQQHAKPARAAVKKCADADHEANKC